VVLLTVRHAPVSIVTKRERFLVQALGVIPHSFQVVARYGYMDHPRHDEVRASAQCGRAGKEWVAAASLLGLHVQALRFLGTVPCTLSLSCYGAPAYPLPS
jgi:hypothetical protein